ncbi:hypothetical protein L873DRAFT_1686018 [Choiromyces venosus 120613-1]|uniref:RNI-like protein n=1 Tax=Choiromyces venosus 120613-1 TaxID=1336337 RepID=A0A3N4JKT3_9PEZI|nr:hypothetical protein L873DRAFT_1686018 [Choiromyces venosus 120613-1]
MVRRKSAALKVHKDDNPTGASLDAKLYEDTIPDAPGYTLSQEKSDPDDMHPPKKKMRRHEKSRPIGSPAGVEERHLEDAFAPAVAMGPRARAHVAISSAAAVRSGKRDQTDAAITTPAGPERKRVALKEKNPNPSSSDIHSIDLHQSFPHNSKQKQNAKKSNLKDDVVAAPQSGTSLLQESFAVGGPVYRALKELLPQKDFRELVELVEEDAAQGVADLVTKKNCWSPELLDSFSGSELRFLDLSTPSSSPSEFLIPDKPPTLILRSLYQQNQFTALTTLSLRNTQLSNNDLSLLMLLTSLADLDISNTGLGIHSLHHIVCHHKTLVQLNLSHNQGMDDDCRVPLAALPKLARLYLRGTSISMPGLRRLVTRALPNNCRLLSLPNHCITYLNDRKSHYSIDIPDSYVHDPKKLENMSLPELRKNLELHARVNGDILLTGSKSDLFNRLNNILQNRLADAKIVKVLGREERQV